MAKRKKLKGYIFRAWRYAKDGTTELWARDYGYKAWRIPVYEK